MLYARRALAVFASLAVFGCGDSVTGPRDNDRLVSDPRADLQVMTITVGDDVDPDGYLYTFDYGRPDRLEPNGVRFIPNLAPGFHWIELRDIADNCELVDGSNPKAVELMYGERNRVTFSLSCGWHGGAGQVE